MTIRARRGIATTFAITLLAASQATPAAARPDPGPQRTPTPSVHRPPYCPLERIGTQFVRCDNLTGAGVPAPGWIPEYGSTAGTMASTTTLPSGRWCRHPVGMPSYEVATGCLRMERSFSGATLRKALK